MAELEPRTLEIDTEKALVVVRVTNPEGGAVYLSVEAAKTLARNLMKKSGEITGALRYEDGISDLFGEVISELQQAIREHGHMYSAHEAYGVIKEEVDEFWQEVMKKKAERSPENMRKELVQIAAMACMAIISLNL